MTDDEWSDFAESMAALDESAAVELDKSVTAEKTARETFEQQQDRLTELLETGDWEGIANEFYDGVNPAEVGEAGTEDGTGTRAVQADASEKPVEQHETDGGANTGEGESTPAS